MRKALAQGINGRAVACRRNFDVTSTSAGEMFLGALVPGMVLVGLYMLYILVYAIINPKAAPAVSYGR